MTITLSDLCTIVRNMDFDNAANDFLKSRIGKALCDVFYTIASEEDNLDDDYAPLAHAASFNLASEMLIFLCEDFADECKMDNVVLDINLD